MAIKKGTKVKARHKGTEAQRYRGTKVQSRDRSRPASDNPQIGIRLMSFRFRSTYALFELEQAGICIKKPKVKRWYETPVVSILPDQSGNSTTGSLATIFRWWIKN